MLSHIVTDLHKTYITEVLEPKLGKGDSGDQKPESKEGSSPGKTPDEQSAKRIRQAVYDIRYRARREDIALDQAYNQYMSHTSMNAMEKSTVREKLGLGSSGGGSVKEENIPEAKKYLRVDPSKRGTGEKVYYRSYDPSKSKDIEKRHKLETRGIKTTATQYVPKGGMPYDASKDQDGDGDNDFADVQSARMQASGMSKEKANKKVENKPYNKKTNKPVKEGFSNWREDLFEVVNKINDVKDKNEIIKEKPVDNKIVINPVINIEQSVGGQLIESFEIEEDHIVNVATEYFYEHGLNDDGIDILVEDIGEDNFVTFVFEIFQEYNLTEARTLLGKKKSPATGKARGVSLKAAPGKTTKAAVEAGGTNKKLSSTLKKKTVAVKRAVEKQPEKKETPKASKTGIAGRVGAVLGHVVKRAKQDTELLKKSVQTARGVAARRGAEVKAVHDAVRARGKKAEQSPQATRARRKATVAVGRAAQAAGKTAVKAAKAAGAATGEGVKAHREGKTRAQVAGRAAGTFVRKMASEDFELWIYELVEQGYDLSGHTCEKMWEIYSEEFETEALDTWNPETTTDTSDSNSKIQARKQALKAKQKKVKVDPNIRNLLPPDFKESFELNEKLTKSTPVSTFVHDFVHSKNKTFSGDSKKQRINRALGAYYSKHPEKSKVNEAAVSNIPGKSSQNQSATTETQKNTQQKQLKNTQNKPQNQSAISSVLVAKQTADTAQRNLAQKQKSAAQKGVNLSALSASYEMKGDSIDETKLGYALQKVAQRRRTSGDVEGASRAQKVATKQFDIASDLGKQKMSPVKRQQAKQRYEREPEDKYGHPSLSAKERNPSLR